MRPSLLKCKFPLGCNDCSICKSDASVGNFCNHHACIQCGTRQGRICHTCENYPKCECFIFGLPSFVHNGRQHFINAEIKYDTYSKAQCLNDVILCNLNNFHVKSVVCFGTVAKSDGPLCRGCCNSISNSCDVSCCRNIYIVKDPKRCKEHSWIDPCVVCKIEPIQKYHGIVTFPCCSKCKEKGMFCVWTNRLYSFNSRQAILRHIIPDNACLEVLKESNWVAAVFYWRFTSPILIKKYPSINLFLLTRLFDNAPNCYKEILETSFDHDLLYSKLKDGTFTLLMRIAWLPKDLIFKIFSQSTLSSNP